MWGKIRIKEGLPGGKIATKIIGFMKDDEMRKEKKRGKGLFHPTPSIQRQTYLFLLIARTNKGIFG